jgi:hypothetical protein
MDPVPHLNYGEQGAALEELRRLLLPILADGVAGNFERDVPIPREGSPELVEVLMGVQMLLKVIREQRREMERTREELWGFQARTAEILARVVDGRLPGPFMGQGEDDVVLGSLGGSLADTPK